MYSMARLMASGGVIPLASPAATSRLLADPAQEPKLRYLAKGTGNDHSDNPIPAEHQDFDYLEWIARLTSLLPESGWLKARRKSWARLIRHVYETDPMLCRCGERMRVVGFITKVSVVRMILDHVGRKLHPFKLPGMPTSFLFDAADGVPSRSSPRFDEYAHDPFPDYGSQ
jgi:hypothetical protein